MISKQPKKETPTIPLVEWEKICSESRSANTILNNPDFKFLLDYLDNSKKSAINLIATNSIKDLVETQSDSRSGYSKSIKTTKEEQINEIAGCLKFIDKLLSDLNTLSTQESEYLKLADQKKLIIEVSKEK